MARLLPELLVDDDRRADLLVAAARLELAHRALERPPDQLALRVPEGRARRDVVEAEQVELDAQPAMVALLRLRPAPQIRIELVLGRPDRAVDPLEGRPLLVAAPVRTRDREQLERPDPACARDMRPLAQVDERAVLVDADGRHRHAVGLGLRGEVVEDLDLERLVPLGEEGPPLLRRQLAPDERMVGCDRGSHPFLDLREIGRCQRPVELEVVVEPVGDRGPDPELGAREEVGDGLGHHVGGRVAHRVEVAVGAGVEELVGRATLRRVEERLLLDRLDLLLVHHDVLQESNASRPKQDERFDPPAVPPAFAASPPALRRVARALVAALTGGSRTGSPVAHGWCLDRRSPPGSQPGPGSLEATAAGLSRSSRCRCGGRHWTRTSDLLHVKQQGRCRDQTMTDVKGSCSAGPLA